MCLSGLVEPGMKLELLDDLGERLALSDYGSLFECGADRLEDILGNRIRAKAELG